MSRWISLIFIISLFASVSFGVLFFMPHAAMTGTTISGMDHCGADSCPMSDACMMHCLSLALGHASDNDMTLAVAVALFFAGAFAFFQRPTNDDRPLTNLLSFYNPHQLLTVIKRE